MYPLAHVVKVTLPEYLAGLPVPDSFTGWFRLGVRDWLSLIPPIAVTAGISYMSYKAFCPKAHKHPINPLIRKDVAKVVDTIDIEDITDKVVLCRCWRSENWPYCDGKHGPHNRETGDNIGPVVIKANKK